MWIFPLIGYLGVIVGFGFLTLAIASGLYYLSELVEEHTVLSKKLLIFLIQAIIVIHFLLLIFDGFPLWLTLFSAASHAVYLANVTKSFPEVRLSDPIFLLACTLVVANHYFWFKHFSHPPLPSDHPYSSNYVAGSPYDYSTSSDPYFNERFPSFTEISAFFGICVWFIPFSLFVSLSASDNVLPSSEIGGGSNGAGLGGAGRKKEGMAKTMFNSIKDWFAIPTNTRHERFE